jgi:general nucleoside transport system permease protein
VIVLTRRLEQPRYLAVAMPFLALAGGFVLSSVVLLLSGHDPITVHRLIIEKGFLTDSTALLRTATPLVYTGLAAALAFRMRLWNIGGDGQLMFGAVVSSGLVIEVGDQGAGVLIPLAIAGGLLGGLLWAVVPALLRARFQTNEIITTLMLNYVAAQLLNYLIVTSHSLWRDPASPTFPNGRPLPHASEWPHFAIGPFPAVPLGFLLALVLAVALAVVWRFTRPGFEMQVIGDSPSAARYAGMRTRLTLFAVLCASAAIAGLGGASRVGDADFKLDHNDLIRMAFGYGGIVVAALARYDPLVVVLVALALGGFTNAAQIAQDASTLPLSLVGVIQGTILLSALAAELFTRYTIGFRRRAPRDVPEEIVVAPEHVVPDEVAP